MLLFAALLAAAEPEVAPASDEPNQALQCIRLPDGWKATVWAAEPMLANPVAFTFNQRGHCFVAETFRHGDGVTDIRGHMNWLDDDLACRTVDDRLALLRKHTPTGFERWTRQRDRVRRLIDTHKTGRADRSDVFADNFHSPVSGIGAGLLARGDTVWYTCVPDLWRFDTRPTGNVEPWQLATGFGVRNGFIGHDLHGLTWGPDGRIYFTCGDRGLNVTTLEGKKLQYPDTGCVLRCWPDGTQLEVFASGLRNPQELAFDEHGNLFTCDNNCDAGDKARWTHIVEGGDYGWRIGYQFITEPNPRGEWMSDSIWKTDGNVAYRLPPAGYVGDGPSGLCYFSGKTESDQKNGRAYVTEIANTFLLADFRGGSSGSGIRAVRLQPSGATFTVKENKPLIWNVLATDVDFGPDGAIYVLDWTEGWAKTGKGRIYRVTTGQLDAAVAARRMVEGREFVENLKWLEGVWNTANLARARNVSDISLVDNLHSHFPTIRAVTARLIGEMKMNEAATDMIRLLNDYSPRVRFESAVSLGKVGNEDSTKHLIDLLVKNNNRDAYLRHAAVMGLYHLGMRSIDLPETHDSAAVRLGLVLAYRRLKDPAVCRFLTDPDPLVATEAARAVHDEQIPDRMALSELLGRANSPVPVQRRALNSHFRLGKPENAAAMARFAASDGPEAMRAEALQLLATWAEPSGRDRILGVWRPLAPRPAAVAVEALTPNLPQLFAGPDGVRRQLAATATALQLTAAASGLRAMLKDVGGVAETRAAALDALVDLNADGWADAVRLAATDPAANVRSAAARAAVKLPAEQALPILELFLKSGDVRERQAAVKSFAAIRGAESAAILARLFDELAAGRLPPELHLDVSTAVGSRPEPELQNRLKQWKSKLSPDDHLAEFRVTLHGGDAERGRKQFMENAAAACLRCHKIGNDGGDVGPNLSDAGKRLSREQIVESITHPDKAIAKGYETVVVTTDDGKQIIGVVKAEDDTTLTLITAEAKVIAVAKTSIEERRSGPSAMPGDMMKHLTKSDLRDLVEYLSGQR